VGSTQRDKPGLEHALAPAGGGPLLTTGDMARRSNSTLRTVRFYEEEGILRPAKRSEGGHRLFPESELDRLQLVSDLRASGLSLDEIKALLELKTAKASGGEAANEATRALAVRIEELGHKLEVLTRLRDDLTRTAGAMAECLGCTDPKFPHHCDTCTVMQPHDLPRGMRVLWSGPAGGEPCAAPGAARDEDDG
jgi:MerR family transcriptional regulator, Zn(II)-responsive regulator of zntA